MDKKQLIMLGGSVLAGGAVFFFLSRNSGTSAAAYSPAPSLGVPSMPVANIAPAPIDITDAPVYQTINFPTNRDLVQPDKSEDGCGCGGACNSGLGVGAVLTNDQLAAWTSNISNVVRRSQRAPSGVV